ncbi:probable arginine--tRNA ligase, mitochondrial isoform X2 [Hylaeus volcanicus]|uniref:probable arginine--tRNA ligase, mitochondrial isoform X2 n=1 Tax=Hylaeus volcanicus TaxID=313075 RepID=UPI0023B83D0E|nr:probable arginine--tRNA ligase, mitochondrial isoform X2 [Hylaeus volcanicus]
MSNILRSIIFKKVTQPLQNVNNAYKSKIMSELKVHLNNSNNMYCFTLPLKSEHYNISDEVPDIIKNDLEDTFDNVRIENNTILFNILRDKYIKTILESNHSGLIPPLLIDNNKHVIVEFSSPNIAKPFHFGHLRSTIIGNCIANINDFLHNKVKKINYLGDWGTQFGLVQLGIELANIDDIQIQKDPLKALLKAYVTANELASSDPTISERARDIFTQLELGENTYYKKWQTFKHYTVQELEKTYKRINVSFDEYHWESMYSAINIKHIISLMEELQLLELDHEDRKVIPITESRNIPILKSDGSTLYMTRDIAAAIDRFEKYKFDAMYYVVDTAQNDHFLSLITILNKLKLPWANKLKHVKFGRVIGMSTRKDESDNSSDILGISSVIIHDLKRRRTNDYKFNWDLILDMKGDCGAKLQYTHCRLTNLEYNSGATLVAECNPSLLKETEVDNLIILISKFDEVILKSYEQLEPCILTVYLFHLCHAVDKAFKTLRIKNQPPDLGNQRLLLFHTAKIILAEGMKLLGLTPLKKM